MTSKPKLTHPNKVLYPEDGIRKIDLFHYYEAISSHILPFIRQRPLTLVRCPSHYQDCFFQKNLDASMSKALHNVPLKDRQYIYLDDENGLLELVQMGVLEIHVWGSQITQLDYPDMITFDLDPAPEVHWKQVVSAAFEIRQYLKDMQLESFVKSTGGKGLHVVIPILPEYSWEDIKQFTHVFSSTLEKTKPDLYVSNMSKEKRKGKIFVDYLRNQREATAIAAYSTRARLHAPVATPLAWDELTDDKKATEFMIFTLPERLKTLKTDPWEAFWSTKQSLTPFLK